MKKKGLIIFALLLTVIICSSAKGKNIEDEKLEVCGGYYLVDDDGNIVQRIHN